MAEKTAAEMAAWKDGRAVAAMVVLKVFYKVVLRGYYWVCYLESLLAVPMEILSAL